MSTANAKLRDAVTAINGPPGCDRRLDDIIYEPKKVKKLVEQINQRAFPTHSEVGAVIDALRPPKT